ncbi:diphthamide biosynthesis protein-like protein 4 [Thozetella sp. PMI_491]|nr:diphthamide biosynthesis protein-like protein 4 [Thozetella sp. PMI_491]
MPDSPDHGPAATYYDVLGISPSVLSEQKDPGQTLKRAYHRALLQHHPDKRGASPTGTSLSTTGVPARIFSVDEISTAYAILSNSRERAEYDGALKLAASSNGQQHLPQFQTGIENVDLDDLDYEEGTERWSRGCRCGNPKGYLFGEEDLEEAVDYGELMVGCADCSLWLKVHFAVMDDVPGGISRADQRPGGG